MLARVAVIGGTYISVSRACERAAKEIDQKITSPRGQAVAWVAGIAVPALATIGIMRQTLRFSGYSVCRALSAREKAVAAVALGVGFLVSKRNPFFTL